MAESDQLDFKGYGYDMSTRRHVRELVADVASLANARGGVLVLGIGTHINDTQRVEVATRLVGARPGTVDRGRYLAMIKDHVAPLIRNVAVDVAHDHEHEFGLIEVEPQNDWDQPFLVDRLVDEEGANVPKSFGWPERSADTTYWHPLARVQQLVVAGLGRAAPATEPREESDDEELAAADQLAEVTERSPSLAIQISPAPEDTDMPNFFGDVQAKLRQWTPVRANGFGFNTSWHALKPAGNRLVAAYSGTSFVLGRRGPITEVVALDSGWFQWATPPSDDELFINPAALTEWVAEAIRTAYDFVGPLLVPRAWRIKLLARNLQGDRTVAISRIRHMAPISAWAAVAPSATVRLNGTGDWRRDAFDVLTEIYGQGFGQGEDKVFGGNRASRSVDIAAFDQLR